MITDWLNVDCRACFCGIMSENFTERRENFILGCLVGTVSRTLALTRAQQAGWSFAGKWVACCEWIRSWMHSSPCCSMFEVKFLNCSPFVLVNDFVYGGSCCLQGNSVGGGWAWWNDSQNGSDNDVALPGGIERRRTERDLTSFLFIHKCCVFRRNL